MSGTTRHSCYHIKLVLPLEAKATILLEFNYLLVKLLEACNALIARSKRNWSNQ